MRGTYWFLTLVLGLALTAGAGVGCKKKPPKEDAGKDAAGQVDSEEQKLLEEEEKWSASKGKWDEQVKLAQGTMRVHDKNVTEGEIGVTFFPGSTQVDPGDVSIQGSMVGGGMMKVTLLADAPLEEVAKFYMDKLTEDPEKNVTEIRTENSIVYTCATDMGQIQVNVSKDPKDPAKSKTDITRIRLDKKYPKSAQEEPPAPETAPEAAPGDGGEGEKTHED